VAVDAQTLPLSTSLADAFYLLVDVAILFVDLRGRRSLSQPPRRARSWRRCRACCFTSSAWWASQSFER